MKTAWKVVKYALIIGGALFFLLLVSVIPDYVYFMPRAKPPRGMTNLQTFFEWKPMPMSAWRITIGNSVYYQLTGPAGRSLPSGPAAYAFDANGQFIGWTADSGDFFTPAVIYEPGAKRERVSVTEVRALVSTNSAIQP